MRARITSYYWKEQKVKNRYRRQGIAWIVWFWNQIKLKSARTENEDAAHRTSHMWLRNMRSIKNVEFEVLLEIQMERSNRKFENQWYGRKDKSGDFVSEKNSIE